MILTITLYILLVIQFILMIILFKIVNKRLDNNAKEVDKLLSNQNRITEIISIHNDILTPVNDNNIFLN